MIIRRRATPKIQQIEEIEEALIETPAPVEAEIIQSLKGEMFIKILFHSYVYLHPDLLALHMCVVRGQFILLFYHVSSMD